MFVAPGVAFAVTTQWIGATSNWITAANWSAGVPDMATDVTIANGGTAFVSVNPAHGGLPLPDGVAKTVTLGMNGHSGSLGVGGGAWLNVANDITVGEFGGTGTLNLGDTFFGGTQLNCRAAYIGRTLASRGDVVVDNSHWINSSELVVGTDTVGTLTIQDKGSVSNTVGYIGSAVGSSGSVSVTGQGSAWENNNSLVVGLFGTGALSIANRGYVSSTLGQIGRQVGSSGGVTIDGALTGWGISGDLKVGGLGTGSLSLTNGGSVTDNIGSIGESSGSMGTATVAGPGSTWTNSNDIDVGQTGNGLLEISGGGKVSNLRGHVGFSSGSSGSVIVRDPGSTWTGSGSFFIGNGGSGSLQVLNGATVSTAGNSYLGFSSGSSGSAVVSGAGSSWSAAAQLIVGGSLAAAGGSGYLRIDDGGVVSANGGITIRSTGSLVGNGMILANVVNEGDVAPGDSPGTIHIAGNYDQQPGAVLEMQIGATDSANFDHLIVDGNASIQGQLVIQIIDGFLPHAGDQFDLLSVSGAFNETANVSFTGVSDAWQFSQAFDPATGMVVLTSLNDASPVPVPGDYNGDGNVDAADYTVWRDTLGQAGVGLPADGDGSGLIDAGDYDVWTTNFGNHAGAGASSNTAVPEPATLIPLLVGILAMCFCRLLNVSKTHGAC